MSKCPVKCGESTCTVHEGECMLFNAENTNSLTNQGLVSHFKLLEATQRFSSLN